MTPITDSVGRVLGKRYRLLSAVGSGSSAQVFLAQDVTLRRHVAVKVLQPGLAQDETFLGRFRAEARFVASLNHPNVLRVFDWGEDTDGPYLVLEYLGGGSLLDLLDSGARLDPAQAALLGAQAARGLAYAHARGLVHRDVKPANLLFDEEGRVRVADFGVARALAEAAWTEPGNVMVGTARYASPEQAQGRSLDGKADVYSLALVMFESVTGELPFCADTTVGTLMARLGRSLPKHRALGPLQEILEVAARPDPSTRPNAAQLAGRLESLVSSLPVASALPLVPRLPVLAPAPPPAPTSSGGAPTLVATGVMVQDAGKTVVPPVHSPNSGWPLSPTPGQVFDREALQSSRRRSPSFAKSRRGRWPWVLAALLLALIIAGGLLAAVKGQLFTPSHPVPELKGLSVPAADKLLAKDKFGLHKAGLVYSITIPRGAIVSQQPVRGHSMKEGNAGNVLLSKGVPSVAVPQPAGLNCAGAERLLAEAHLKATCPAAIDYSPTVASGNVINWSYNGKLNPTKAPYGSTILLAVSNG